LEDHELLDLGKVVFVLIVNTEAGQTDKTVGEFTLDSLTRVLSTQKHIVTYSFIEDREEY